MGVYFIGGSMRTGTNLLQRILCGAPTAHERLEEAGFFFPEHKAPMMKRNLRNMWTRFSMTRQEVQTLHGALRQLLRARDQ